MDWVAGALELLSCWLIGSRKRYAFLIGLGGNIAWVAYVAASGTAHGLLLVCVPMATINVRNWFKWGSDGEGRQET